MWGIVKRKLPISITSLISVEGTEIIMCILLKVIIIYSLTSECYSSIYKDINDNKYYLFSAYYGPSFMQTTAAIISFNHPNNLIRKDIHILLTDAEVTLIKIKWNERVAWLDSRSEKVLPWVLPIHRRCCVLEQAEGGSKFRGLEEGEKFNQSLVNKHFASTDQWV